MQDSIASTSAGTMASRPGRRSSSSAPSSSVIEWSAPCRPGRCSISGRARMRGCTRERDSWYEPQSSTARGPAPSTTRSPIGEDGSCRTGANSASGAAGSWARPWARPSPRRRTSPGARARGARARGAGPSGPSGATSQQVPRRTTWNAAPSVAGNLSPQGARTSVRADTEPPVRMAARTSARTSMPVTLSLTVPQHRRNEHELGNREYSSSSKEGACRSLLPAHAPGGCAPARTTQREETVSPRLARA